MIWVTMTDKGMSNWGLAAGKINKVVIECDNMADAIIVENNAKKRKEMKYVNICFKKPHYSLSKYYTSFRNKKDGSGRFKNQSDWS